MAVMELTLNALNFANVYGFERDFGTKKSSNVNGGSLTTKEFNVANALPFDLMRPTVINETTSIIKVEYDAKLNINAPSEITLTIGNGTYVGQTCSIYNSSNVAHKVSLDGDVMSIGVKSKLKFEWCGDKWYTGENHPLGYVLTQYPDCPSPVEMKLFGTWTELKFGGVYFRSEGTNAKPFTNSMKVSVNGTTVTVDTSKPNVAEILATLEVGDLLISEEECRTVTEISGNVVTIDESFTHSDITTVIIGQSCGLPNITGTLISTAYPSHSGYGKDFTGAFKRNNTFWNGSDSDAVKPVVMYNADFDASRSSSIYGKSERVTTDNITVKYWKRVA